VKALQNIVDNYKSNTLGTFGYSLNDKNFDNPGYIIGYMVEKTRATDPAVVTHQKIPKQYVRAMQGDPYLRTAPGCPGAAAQVAMRSNPTARNPKPVVLVNVRITCLKGSFMSTHGLPATSRS
jgi:hypothetical protein